MMVTVARAPSSVFSLVGTVISLRVNIYYTKGLEKG